MTKSEKDELYAILSSKPFMARLEALKWLDGVSIAEEPKQPSERQILPNRRTLRQNKAIHLWLTWVAEELDKSGHTVQDVVEKIKRAEIRPTEKVLKEVLWKPYQLASVQKDSSTKLTKLEVDKIYEGLNKFLGEHFHISIPFPKRDSDEDKHPVNQPKPVIPYPTYTGKPTI